MKLDNLLESAKNISAKTNYVKNMKKFEKIRRQKYYNNFLKNPYTFYFKKTEKKKWLNS